MSARRPLSRDERRRALILFLLMLFAYAIAALIEPCDNAPDCRAPTAIRADGGGA
jgi:hypothetical protein